MLSPIRVAHATAPAHYAEMLELKDVHVVSHTHWDREWYHTAERFRQRLVVLVDELLDHGSSDDDVFLLDGQAILLEDYLAVRPERAAELATMLRERRIEAGPWYVLADELIPSGEVLVRNLLVGRDIVRRLRGEPPPVLYCPDSFGHPAILPDLAAGFGCGLIVMWRGYGGARAPVGDVVRWRGAAGGSALVYHLPPDGYEFGSSLPPDADPARQRWASLHGLFGSRTRTGTVLLLNGADHHARQRGHEPAIGALTAAAAPVRVLRSSLAEFGRALAVSAADVDLPEIAGELRDSYGYTWTLQGTLATRAAQKRRNAIAERVLVRDVEPWLALAGRTSPDASRALLDAAWRTLLLAHPHDTLCGTSIDAVATALDARVAAAGQQAAGLREMAVAALVAYDAEAARAGQEAWQPAVVIRNPAARPRGGVVELVLRQTVADVAVGPGSAQRQGARRRPARWQMEGGVLQVLSRAERIALTEAPRAYPDADLIVEARAVAWIEPVPGYVVETRPVRKGRSPVVPNPVVTTERSLDNGLVRVEVADDGTVSFIDQVLGRRVTGVVTLEREQDVGDLYTPAIRGMLASAQVVRLARVHRGPIRGELAIDYRVSDRRGGGTCRIALQLDADARALRIVVSGENRERDHRLRLRVATGLASATTVADAAFHPVVRAPLVVRPDDVAMEHVVSTAPLHRWVARFSEHSGAVLVSDGLAEYESADDGSVAVTLVRAVGELSRADLPERPGHAGWPAPTPEAQCIGPYAARFALRLTGGDTPGVRDEIERFAEDELVPIVGETLRSNLLPPRSAGGLELVGDGLAFSAAMPARREGWVVLRCVNRRDAEVQGEWRLGQDIFEALEARLDETPSGSVDVRGNAVMFVAAPRAIVTILVRV